MTSARFALPRVLSRDDDFVPTPASKRVIYLEQNVAAFCAQLTASDVQHLDAVFPVAVAVADRYAEMSTVR